MLFLRFISGNLVCQDFACLSVTFVFLILAELSGLEVGRRLLNDIRKARTEVVVTIHRILPRDLRGVVANQSTKVLSVVRVVLVV